MEADSEDEAERIVREDMPFDRLGEECGEPEIEAEAWELKKT